MEEADSTTGDSDTHRQRRALSDGLLDKARGNASKERGYQSERFRSEIVKAFENTMAGRRPYDWQVDVAEALWLGLDTAVIAGTGAGKTMPFVMPLLVDQTAKKMVIIISPLNELEEDQARRFREMGLTATAVNGEIYTMQLHKELLASAYRVVITSPEMCLEHVQFSALVQSPDFMRHVLYLVIDEAHCISQWGASFRTKFAELSRMRSFLGVRKPLLLTSATLPPFMLQDVFRQLEFSEPTTYFINLGNNRPNITPIVHRLKAAQSSLPVLEFLVREALPGTPLPRTIVFFNTRDLAFTAYRYLQDCVPEDLSSQISFLHAGRGQRARRRVMHDFREGKINILCATEAAGMGMDISGIHYVVQFLAASSLSVWTQRAGRAGRSGDAAYAILLVEPGIFNLKPSSPAKAAVKTMGADLSVGTSSKGGAKGGKGAAKEGKGPGAAKATDLFPAPASGVVEYKKKSEDGMRSWASTDTCRRDIADVYFANPPRTAHHERTFPCCDNCVIMKRERGDILSDAELRVLQLIDRIAGGVDLGQEANDAEYDENDEEQSAEIAATQDGPPPDIKPEPSQHPSSRSIGNRRDDHLLACRARLVRWRMECWLAHYSQCSFSPLILLPDKILTQLATQARLQTTNDILNALPQWVFASKHSAEVLALLSVVDVRHNAEKQARQQQAKEDRAKRSAENKEKRDEERRVRRRKESEQRRLSDAGLNFVFVQPTAFLQSISPFTTPTGPLLWQAPQISGTPPLRQ